MSDNEYILNNGSILLLQQFFCGCESDWDSVDNFRLPANKKSPWTLYS